MSIIKGIEVERTSSGFSRFVRIDLYEHPDVASYLEDKGLVVDEPINWSKKMLTAFEEVKRGQIRPVDLDNFWNIDDYDENV